MLLISDGDTTVAVEVQGCKAETEKLPPMTFLPKRGVITMDACHCAENRAAATGQFKLIQHYGQYETAMKVFPVTRNYAEEDEKPELTYRFLIPQAGAYKVEILTAPTNPAVKGQEVRIYVTGGDCRKTVTLIPSNYRAGESGDSNWSKGVLNQIHVAETVIHFGQGVQELTLGAMEAGTVLERIRIYPENHKLPASYLGPQESAYAK